MALEGISEAEIEKLEAQLMAEVIEQGGRVGNTSLMRALGWDESRYWPVRDRLVDQGKIEPGRGKGGSVRLVPPPPATPEPEGVPQTGTAQPPGQGGAQGLTRVAEDALYSPVADVLRSGWAKDKRYRDVVVEITARQGKRDTGGRWTRPDVTVASMTTMLYVPGKLFDVTTFEIKPVDSLDVTAVYEALAHRRAATRSYVWLHVPGLPGQETALEETVAAIIAEAKRHGIGVITGSDPADYDTWEEEVEAVRYEPDPLKLNEFIAVQFSAGNKDELLKWMR